MKSFYVYIAASISRRIYVGVTNDLERRAFEHRHKLVPGFTARYQIIKIVYAEETADVLGAITREKEIKGWRREKKVALIETTNPHWHDLLQVPRRVHSSG